MFSILPYLSKILNHYNTPYQQAIIKKVIYHETFNPNSNRSFNPK